MTNPYQSPARGSFGSSKNSELLSERACRSRIRAALLIGFVANGLVVVSCARLLQHPPSSHIGRPLFGDPAPLIALALGVFGVSLCVSVLLKTSGGVRALAILGVLVNLAPLPVTGVLIELIIWLMGYTRHN